VSPRTRSALDVRDLGRCPYGEALRIQEDLLEARAAGEAPDTLLLVEHDPVYTLGRTAQEGNVILSPEELRKRGIELFQVGRGGDVTYHGPGQLVGYPILHLRERRQGVLWHVETLEKILIDVLADFGIEGGTDSRNRGAWVGNDKIAAIGVRIRKQVTMHGFALNVKVDLADYGGIVPCGLSNAGVTSMHCFLPDIRIEEVKEKVIFRCREEWE
jgi:lipoate-protein ligase B